ncbi:MAG: hypothetical protein QG574_4335 [Cyanobacteriota bacterium erpe_2018_sw_21hr_WHONDRS-SW48-000092_B_bin.40]|nr:hypothetical protein [Cyanobacteriota bacterium erpe_2018_sw_21hr_WHONDRS-SW48-000092_B_bin.40]
MPIERENQERGLVKEVESPFPSTLDLMHSGQEKKPANLLSSFGNSFGYELIEARVDGVLQIFDQTGKTRLGLFDVPEHEKFASPNWFAQQLGGAAGTAVTFLLLRKAAGAAIATKTESSAAAIGSQSLRQSLTSAALTGGIYQGIFTPSDTSKRGLDFFTNRLENAGIGAATFTTLVGSAHGLNYLGKSANLSWLRNNIVNSTASGLPAGFVSAELSTRGNASGQELFESMFTYSAIGGVMAGAHSLRPANLKAMMSKSQLADSTPKSVERLVEKPIEKTADRPGERLAEKPREKPPEQSREKPIERVSDRQVGKVAEVVPIAQLAAEMKTFPDAHSFKQQLGNRAVGTLPVELVNGGLPQAAVFKKLDDLAIMLRSVDCNLPSVKKQGLGATDLGLPEFKVQLGDTTVGVKRVGVGETASVYRLTADGKDFAFKVVHDPARIDVHGSYSEAGAFTFLSKYPIRDLVKFHASNPGSSGGWLLNDFVTKPVNQTGLELREVLAKNKLVLGDDWSANRGPGGIVWDVGGIEPVSVVPPKSLAEFRDLLNSSQDRMIAGRKMSSIDNAQVKDALMLALDYPQVSGQVPRSAARLLHDKNELADVLRKALNTPGAAGRAAFELDYLKGTAHIKELYYEALKNPESRIEAAKQIDRLAPQDRKQAIDAAFKYPESRAMAARAIASLPEGPDKTKAMQMAEQDMSARIALALQGNLPKASDKASHPISEWLTEHLGLGR